MPRPTTLITPITNQNEGIHMPHKFWYHGTPRDGQDGTTGQTTGHHGTGPRDTTGQPRDGQHGTRSSQDQTELFCLLLLM